MDIKIEKLTEKQLTEKGVFDWSVWKKEISKFDWFYDSQEECYLLEGEVVVIANGKEYLIKKGDFVTFPEGLKCVWNIKSPIKKHYNFN